MPRPAATPSMVIWTWNINLVYTGSGGFSLTLTFSTSIAHLGIERKIMLKTPSEKFTKSVVFGIRQHTLMAGTLCFGHFHVVVVILLGDMIIVAIEHTLFSLFAYQRFSLRKYFASRKFTSACICSWKHIGKRWILCRWYYKCNHMSLYKVVILLNWHHKLSTTQHIHIYSASPLAFFLPYVGRCRWDWKMTTAMGHIRWGWT